MVFFASYAQIYFPAANQIEISIEKLILCVAKSNSVRRVPDGNCADDFLHVNINYRNGIVESIGHENAIAACDNAVRALSCGDSGTT